MAITYVAAGAVSAATGGSTTPAIPAGVATDDLLVLLDVAWSASLGTPTTPGTPSGWTQRATYTSNGVRLTWLYRRWASGVTAPTVTGGGGSDEHQSQIIALRGAPTTGDPTDALGAGAAMASSSTATGSVTGVSATAAEGIVLVAAGRNNDLTDGGAWSVLSGDSLTWAEIAEYGGVAGQNYAWAWDRALYTGPLTITAKSFTMTGNSNAAPGAGQMWAIAAALLDQTVSPGGIASSEAFGTAVLTAGAVTVSPTGIPSAEAFGTPQVAYLVSPAGIASGEVFGTPTLTVGPATVSPAGIASGEAFGLASIALTVSPVGIASGEAFGLAQVTNVIGPSGIASGEAFGLATITTGPVTVSAAGIASGEAFGMPSISVTLNLARLAGLVDTTQSGYELQCIARIPQQSGPPALLTVDRIRWKALRYADVLSRQQELSATVRVASISDLVAQRLLGPDRQATELRLLRDGQIVAAGPLAGWHRRGADVELVASGLLGYFRRMIVLADLRFDQVDQHLIAKALVDQWQASAYGHAHYGIDTSQVSPSGKLRDRSYVRDEQHKIGQRIEELGAVDGGFDAEVDPTTRQLQLWHPFKGVDRSTGPSAVVLDHRVITSPDVMCSVEADDLASLAFGTSSASGSDTTLSSFAVNADLAASFGLSAVMGSWQDVSEQTTLDDHVRALLAARGQALIVPGPQMRVTPDADLGAYDVGDTVQLELGTDQLGVTGPYRIRKRVVSVAATTGVETVDLELV